MDLPHTTARLMHLTGTSCLMIVFYTGSACSSAPVGTDRGPFSGPQTGVRPPVLVEHPPTSGTDLDGVPQDSDGSDETPETETPSLEDVKILNLEAQIKRVQAQNRQELAEILALYRRLHIELDGAGRSSLIIELFDDPRLEFELLGFELVDRDLSSSTVLAPEVGERAKGLLSDPNPEIRSKAARLIIRLVPPDAMIVLTESLAIETDPVAAEPMLTGIARWPSPEAVRSVLKWFLRDDRSFAAASDAAWSIEESGYWDQEADYPALIDRLRRVDPKLLPESGMKLIARLGDAADLQILVKILLSKNADQQQWAANAMVETPRAVEVLVQAAEENSQLFGAAGDALIRHRKTPEGLRRLVSLPYPDLEIRNAMILRMGESLDNDQLGEAVRLADLDSTLSTKLLSRLLNGNVEITSRVAQGIIWLAELELDELRANRALEAAIALDGASLDPAQRKTIDRIKAESLILLGKMDDAIKLNDDQAFWISSLERTPDPELRKRISGYILSAFGASLSPEQIEQLKSYSEPVEHKAPPDSTPADG